VTAKLPSRGRTDTETKPVPASPEVLFEEARRRRRRRWMLGGLLSGAVLLGGVLMGFGGGGGGAGAVANGRGNGSSPASGAHTASQVGAASPYSPPSIAYSGLLSPGVGWAVNGRGFYMTWDGGRSWANVEIPGLTSDAIEDILTVASPDSQTLMVSLGGGTHPGTCADPDPAGANRPVGSLAISTDAGHHWRISPFPDCRIAPQISFVNARNGFAVTDSGKAVMPEVLYGKTDGARSWHRIGALPKPGPIDFTSLRSGWLLAGNRIYRTSNGGRSWQRATVCQWPANRAVNLVCGPPLFFGDQGVVQEVHAANGVADRTSVSSTANNGQSWTTHYVAVSPKVEGSLAALMSAAGPKDLFVYFQGGVMAKSTDGGSSWQQLPAPQFKGGAWIHFITAKYGWIQDGGSLYATTDGGERWHRMKQIDNVPPTP
jgi:photosystem II stability/assembly factor-like uncharacterized protein